MSSARAKYRDQQRHYQRAIAQPERTQRELRLQQRCEGRKDDQQRRLRKPNAKNLGLDIELKV